MIRGTLAGNRGIPPCSSMLGSIPSQGERVMQWRAWFGGSLRNCARRHTPVSRPATQSALEGRAPDELGQLTPLDDLAR